MVFLYAGRAITSFNPWEDAPVLLESRFSNARSRRSMVVLDRDLRNGCRYTLDAPTTLSLQPPHSANRHDAGCRGDGGDCMAGVIRPKSLAQDAPGIAKSGG